MFSEHEYSTYYKGEYTAVYTTEKAVRAILCRNEDNMKRIAYLEEENKKLKEDAYKDEELAKMKSQLEKMREDYWRGFPISEKEEQAIEQWKEEHEAKKHKLVTPEMRQKAMGVSGGGYKYEFVPTAIGTSGVVRCSCGDCFEFQKIG